MPKLKRPLPNNKFLVTLEQFNPVIGNPEHNAARMVEKLQAAKAHGSNLVFFGELALNGYFSQDLFLNEDLWERTEKAIGFLKSEAKKLQIGFVLTAARKNPDQKKGEKYLVNQMLVYVPQEKVEYLQNKINLPTYSEFDEYRWWQPGDVRKIKPVKLKNTAFAAVICEDGWNNWKAFPDPHDHLYHDDPWKNLNAKSKKLAACINFSASPDWMHKWKVKHHMQSVLAKTFKTPQIFMNVVGAQDQLIFNGRSFIYNSRGKLVLEMKAYMEDSVTLDLNGIDQIPEIPAPVQTADADMQEMDGMLGLYLRDYFRKSGLRPRVVLGLSGGIDSSVVATVLARHVGPENVLGVAMPYQLGKFTQQESLDYARTLSQNLKIQLLTVPVDSLAGLTMIPEAVREWIQIQSGDLTHQNWQARMRADILWAIANAEGRVVVNTTNFTEAAVGYGTIGGDLLGLPLIASLPKTLIFKYARWLMQNQKPSITQAMIDRPPTAELAPGQLDEAELGRYADIDPILETLRLTFGNIPATIKKHLSSGASAAEKEKFKETLKFLADKLLRKSQFKRDYYNRTPQITPFAWLRWQWPSANHFFDLERYLDESLSVSSR